MRRKSSNRNKPTTDKYWSQQKYQDNSYNLYVEKSGGMLGDVKQRCGQYKKKVNKNFHLTRDEK